MINKGIIFITVYADLYCDRLRSAKFNFPPNSNLCSGLEIRFGVVMGCLWYSVVPVCPIGPVNIILRPDTWITLQSSRGNDQPAAGRTDVRHQGAAVGAESFRYNSGFVGIVALREFLSCEPLEPVFSAENVGSVSRSGRTSTLAAMADVKRIKWTAHHVLHLPTEAGTLDFFIHHISSILALNQTSGHLFKTIFTQVCEGQAYKLILLRAKIAAGQADQVKILYQAFDHRA
jgi:hypothetical protein